MVCIRRGIGALRRQWMVGAAFLAIAPQVALASEWNFQPPVTPHRTRAVRPPRHIFGICVVIFVVVFGVMFYSIFTHRKSKGHEAAQFHENTTVEIIWTVIPFLILMVMAWPATKTVIAMKDTSVPDITIKVTGYQWKWNYDYLNDGFGYFSELSTPLGADREPRAEGRALPAGSGPSAGRAGGQEDPPAHHRRRRDPRVVRARSSACKQDAIPGFVRDTWFKADKTGIYRGQCAKLCGKEHGFMPIVVEVQVGSRTTRPGWTSRRRRSRRPPKIRTRYGTLAELVARGEKVYTANCVACHQADRQGHAGRAFPPLDGRHGGDWVPRDAHRSSTVLRTDGKPTAMVRVEEHAVATPTSRRSITYSATPGATHGGRSRRPAGRKVAGRIAASIARAQRFRRRHSTR